MFATLTNAFSGDNRVATALAALVALLVVLGLAYGVYRLAFAQRLRPSGGARGRAPRLGVVDVFGLDGQRQLVIVRRDNIEHLLLLGGPNDLVVEPNIQRAANGRETTKSSSAAEMPSEAPAPVPAPAPAPQRASMARREPVRQAEEAIVAVEPEILAPPRARPAPLSLRPDGARFEPSKPVLVPEPPKPVAVPEPPKPAVAAEPPRPLFAAEPPRSFAAAESPKPFAAAEPPKPFPAAEPPKPMIAAEPPKPAIAAEPPVVFAAVEPPRPVVALDPLKPADPAPSVKPVEPAAGSDPVGKVLVEPPRKAPIPAPSRPLTASPRPSLPPPITPLRPRSAPEPSTEAAKTLAPPIDMRPVKAAEPTPASEATIIVSGASKSAPKAKKDEAFYDLESLEAEMARLLGRDP